MDDPGTAHEWHILTGGRFTGPADTEAITVMLHSAVLVLVMLFSSSVFVAVHVLINARLHQVSAGLG